MVGNLSAKKERDYGAIFAPYLLREDVLFIISSDFCHWGADFDFIPHDKSCGEVWKSVEQLDREGMRLIEEHDAEGFHHYLVRTENTICGRHPIAVFLNAVQQSGLSLKTKFAAYAQSGKAETELDSSVSYASSLTYLA